MLIIALWVCKRNANCVVINWNVDDMVGKLDAEIILVQRKQNAVFMKGNADILWKVSEY
jgi:hypothetical protein